MYGIEHREHIPVNFHAGTFPVAVMKGTVAAENTIAEREPVKLAGGNILPVTAPGEGGGAVTDGLYGIAAAPADAGEEIPVYVTGEYFAAALVLRDGVTAEALSAAFRGMGIFLK